MYKYWFGGRGGIEGGKGGVIGDELERCIGFK